MLKTACSKLILATLLSGLSIVHKTKDCVKRAINLENK